MIVIFGHGIVGILYYKHKKMIKEFYFWKV